MKKTYMTPELLAVTLLHQDNVLTLKTSIEYAGSNNGTADVKEFEFVDDEEGAPTGGGFHSIWYNEW